MITDNAHTDERLDDRRWSVKLNHNGIVSRIGNLPFFAAWVVVDAVLRDPRGVYIHIQDDVRGKCYGISKLPGFTLTGPLAQYR